MNIKKIGKTYFLLCSKYIKENINMKNNILYSWNKLYSYNYHSQRKKLTNNYLNAHLQLHIYLLMGVVYIVLINNVSDLN